MMFASDFIKYLLIIFFLVLAFPIVIYLRHCILFYRFQSRLLYSPGIDFEVESTDKTIEHEEITYQTGDGLMIHAWYIPYIPPEPEVPGDAPDPGNSEAREPPRGEAESTVSPEYQGVILFCHGNIGNVSQRIDSFKIFRELGFSIFIFDYRGYGKSEGSPTEKGTYLDAEGAWNYLVREMKVKPENIIVFGRSLGGGIASYLAYKYQPRALIIESSFTSVPDMAKMIYPRLPVGFLLRYKYNTRKRLKDIHCPVLIIHSPDDRTIPFIHSQILYETANPPKKFLRIKGDHLKGFLRSKKLYTKGLREFFHELPEPFLTAEAAEDFTFDILT
ncbi:MAG: alpha/beta hydrolase [Candidatus Aminicenantes bacterium]|nr:MAG: alpha/beta hydrolase [Candidatus Aminicenantes bacterium]